MTQTSRVYFEELFAFCVPEFNNSVDFSLYPARNACKDLGGRLPTRAELTCMYTNKSYYGNFVNQYYWSSEEIDTTTVWRLNLVNGAMDIRNKTTSTYNARCVR